jgi:peptidoglycan hydrolase-like protein with peptidoglycan-binding domain
MALFETTFGPYVPFGSRVLRRGDAGTDVAVLQAVYNLMLVTMNPPGGPIGSPVDVSGRFDARTEDAVRAIQSYFGLRVDGVAGPDTYFVYGQGVDAHVTYGGPAYGSRNLAVGSQGGDVIALQNRLNCFRYAGEVGRPATGVFDEATARAVVAFKEDAIANGDTGLPLNGAAGSGFFDATWLYALAGGRAIRSGRNGFDVVFLQLLLSTLGFYAGPLTGLYDAATEAAVRAFQKDAGITVDGVVGAETFFRLGRRNPNPAPAPLGIAWPPGATPAVSVCAAPLRSATPDLHPYGAAAHVVNLREGFESLDVTGNFLPDPSHFGARFGAYAFLLFAPGTGRLVTAQPMTRLSGAEPEDWAGSYSPGVKSIPRGRVEVRPTPPGAPDGPYGPTVLVGSLSECH